MQSLPMDKSPTRSVDWGDQQEVGSELCEDTESPSSADGAVGVDSPKSAYSEESDACALADDADHEEAPVTRQTTLRELFPNDMDDRAVAATSSPIMASALKEKERPEGGGDNADLEMPLGNFAAAGTDDVAVAHVLRVLPRAKTEPPAQC